MDSQTELLSVADVAKELNRSTEQVRRYLREGSLPGHRLGGQWFIGAADLAEFRDRARQRPGLLDRIIATAPPDPLAATIAIGGGGGSSIAEGKESYRRAFRWRRD